MDYSEFLRRLGADPHDADPAMHSARQSAEEFEQAANDADRFESTLESAVRLPMPDDLMDQILAVSSQPAKSSQPVSRWRHLAVAAGLLIAVGAAGITWNLNRGWDSVDAYVMDHFRHDGDSLLQQSSGESAKDVEAFFARFDMAAEGPLANVVSVIKYCPTPDGKGVHMVLNTEEGPVTVIYMPETSVEDGQSVDFDLMNALYVSLEKGSAIIIGQQQQDVSSLHALVQRSIIPLGSKA